MLRCDEVSERLLERRYGLLDPAEAADLDAHLAECPTCTAAQADADRTAGLLARAAVLPFPEVKFIPPVEAEVARPAARSTWVSWTIAAGVLLAVGGGVGGPAGRSFLAHQRAQERIAGEVAKLDQTDHESAERQAKRVEAMEAADAARLQFDGVAAEWVRTTIAARNERPIGIEVTGPSAAIPGAPSEYRIRATDKTGKPVEAAVEVSVRDRTGTEYHRATLPPVIQPEAEGPGRPTRFKLPADVWAKLPPGGSDLFLSVAVVPKGGAKVELAEPVKLTAPAFATFLVTDKPLYRPGEPLYFRAVTLDRTRFLPPADDRILRIELRKPDGKEVLARLTARDRATDTAGNPVLGPDGKPVRGVACGAFVLEKNLSGGEYTLAAYELPAGWTKTDQLPDKIEPVAVRKVTVNAYTPDRFRKTLEFDARSYSPGDRVTATVIVFDQDKPVVGAKVRGNVPGIELSAVTDASGKAVLTFTLPSMPGLPDVTLGVTVRKDEVNESISRRVPVPVAARKVEFFPEGGELVAGVPNRVYVRVTTPDNRPADLVGTISDGLKEVAEFRTQTDADRPGANQGLGLFIFTPEAGKRYTLKPTRPSGAAEVPLPPTKADGVVLSVLGGVFDPTAAVPIRVASAGRPRELLIGAYTRGVSLGHKKLSVPANGSAETAITPPAGTPGGVTRVTVFELRGKSEPVPVAERLVFRRPPQSLALAVTAAAGPFTPGQDVQLDLTAKDETGKPAAAVLWVAVVNESVLTLADDRTERTLPAHFLLATEVRKPEQLEHADFFLTDHPKAAEALDLLLGTQGWRRFAEQKGPVVTQQQPAVGRDDIEALLIASGAKAAVHTDPVAAAFEPKYAAAVEALRSAETATATAWNAPEPAFDPTALQAAADEREAASDALRPLTWAVPVVGLAGLGLVVFGRRVWRLLGVALLLLAVGLWSAVSPAWSSYADTWKSRLRTTESARKAGSLKVPNRVMETAIDLPRSGLEGDPREAEGGRGQRNPLRAVSLDARQDTRPTRTALPKDLADRLIAGNVDAKARQAFQDALAQRVAAEYTRGKQFLTRPEREGLDQVMKAIAGPGPFVVREYAHVHTTPTDDPTRTDFTETVFWHPVLVLPDGTGSVRFQLSDSLQSYRVLAAGHTLDGRLGSVTSRLTVRQPLAVDVKLPAEISTADRPRLPVVVSNGTAVPANTTVNVWSDHLSHPDDAVRLTVNPMAGDRRLITVAPTKPGPARVRVSAAAGGDRTDAVERTLTVVPDGFPVSGAVNEVLESKATLKFVPPADPVPGTLSAKLTVFTNALADVRGGLDGLLREPHGCFEQTSSANYPNVLVLGYLSQTGTVHPAVADKARELLERGHQRLISFEVPREKGTGREGFDWFGRFPPHPPLSAYGLVQFADAARVAKVEPELIARTRDYLLSCRDGKGGFRRPTDGHTFGSAPDSVCNAYILWAITEADSSADVAKEVDAVSAEALASGDPYRLALAAAARLNRKQPADDLLAKLAAKQTDGGLSGADATITRSAGADLDTETTALAALAFLKAPKPNRYEANTRATAKWLAGRRGPGGAFGATQATVLTLKALTEFARQNRRPAEAGTLTVRVNGKELPVRPFRTADPEPVTIELPASLLAGPAEIVVSSDAKATYPVSLTWAGHSRRPASDPACPLTLTTGLDKPAYREGETGRVSVSLTNTAATDQGMTVAVVGLPAGLTPPADLKQLRELADAGTVAHFEVIGRDIVFYWRGLGPKQTVSLSFDVHASVPGEYRGPAGRAYLYYAPTVKTWVLPLSVSVGE